MKKVALPAVKKDREYTYGDYLTWPENEPWEIIDGIAWNISAAPVECAVLQGLIIDLREIFAV